MAVSSSTITLFIALCVFLSTRAQLQLQFDVVENTGDGYSVGRPFNSGGTSFGFVDTSCNCSRFFSINSSSSAIRTRGNLDRELVVRIERSDRLNCIVRYMNTTTNSEDNRVLVINVLDVNDETPSFFNLEPVHIINVLENIGIPNPIQSLQPVDNDKGSNGTVMFSITRGNEGNVFQIDRPVGDTNPSSTTRLLYVVEHLDFERERQFNLTITVMDMGVPMRAFNQTLIVSIDDSNDELPTFITSSYSFEVSEDHPLDISIGNITANDLDSSGTILYTIYSNPNMSSVTEPIIYEFIRVDVNTGDIFLIQHIDYDTNLVLRRFSFYVQARNPGQNAVTIATVTVDIMDANDEPPYFVCEDCQSSSNNLTIFVEENSDETILPVFLPFFIVEDDDSEENFRKVNGSILVEFEPYTLTTVRLLTFFENIWVRVGINQTLDREMTPSLTLSLTAHNTAEPPLSGTSTIFIVVTDQNDNAPQFLHSPFHARISDSAPVGKEVLTVIAWDKDAGENSTLSFAITGVDKAQARGWFAINESSGRISVNSSGLDYNSVAGQVTLTVTAVDHGRSPLSSTTTVEITLSPAVTFAPRSFQKYSGYNFFLGERESVYLEFQTTLSRGLLLYQAGLPTKIFTLEVVGGSVRCQLMSGGQVSVTSREALSVTNDRWHSVLVERDREEITLSVWVTDQQAPSETSRLQDSTLAECGARQEGGSEHSLYVGGVDLFALPSNTTVYPDFVGSIRNVIVGTTQLDLECPSQEENTVQGFHRSSSCESAALSCTGAHTTGCVDYAPQPYCSCLGGFNPQACQQEDSYAPIKFQGNAKAEINLDYSFFYDLATADITTSLGPQRRRRRRNTGGEGLMQVVEVSFRPVEISTGLLLYSRTQSFIHVLKIDQNQDMQVITYNVFDIGYIMVAVHIPLSVRLAARALYTATITSTSSEATLTLETNGTREVHSTSQDWRVSPAPAFAQQPQTLVSIGGASEPNDPLYENFTGCISRVAINGIELPLSGLLNVSGGGGLSTEGSVEASCDLCTPNPCGASMQCASDQFGSYDCQCPFGSVLTDPRDGCEPVTNTPTSDVTLPTTDGLIATQNENEFPFYYIIASAVGGLVVIGCVIFMFIMVARCGYNKYEKKKRTYHINNAEVGNGHVPVAKPNFYTTVIPKHSSSESSNHEHSIGSVSTYHEHDIPDDMVDTEIDNPPPFSRRRSTTSAESGIKTDTERDDKSIGGYPRMEDSGNEKETDYSPPESDSDDVTSSCMETALSPSGLNLAGSTSSVSGIPIHVPPPRVPLTPKERKALTPLRPDSSTILSMSEFDDETDFETDIPYKPVPRPHRALGNRSSDSDSFSRTSASEPGTPKWYKSSTASDTEREKLRAQGTRPYYPTHSEPQRTYLPRKAPPPNHPPDYKSPPTFVQRKNSTPSYSSQRPHLQSVDSPLSRSLKQAYRSVPHSPLSAQPQNNPHLTHTPELLSKSQPNRFQYNSAHHQLNSPQGYPYLFTSTSAPYHPRSFSGGDAPQDPPSQQQFQDLKSVSRINPISYWEMQDRMKSTVDQVDPYHILSEPYVQFEDVSTDPSVTESQLTMDESDRLEHQDFSSQGGGEGTADLLDLSLMRLQDGDIDSMVTDGPDIGPPITHFPSADCSEEYTHTNSLVTLVASSRDSSPKQLSSGLSNGFVVPSSQEPFDV